MKTLTRKEAYKLFKWQLTLRCKPDEESLSPQGEDSMSIFVTLVEVLDYLQSRGDLIIVARIKRIN